MKKANELKNELEKIVSPHNKNAVTKFLEEVVPDYFWHVPASSTGKYHPNFAQGEGGLVRHTKAAMCVAEELLRLEEFMYANRDIVYAAIIIHDCFKYG